MENCANLFARKSEQQRGRERAGVSAGHAGSSAGTTIFHACSACAGDYEDPDRTAWALDEADGDADDSERDSSRRAEQEKFPAEE